VPFKGIAEISKRKDNPVLAGGSARMVARSLSCRARAQECFAKEIPKDQSSADSAVYDAERTAELFCLICNRMKDSYRDAQERARALGWHNAGALGAAG
jgi:hypothetical protein